MASFYSKKNVVVTGGAGFIGSALSDRLIGLGAKITIVDNLSSGNLKNIKRVFDKNKLKYKKTNYGLRTDLGHKFIFANLEEFSDAKKSLRNQEIIFHLAANIGGRGYIDTHPADCCEGFSINQNVIKAAHENKVNRIFFASSACVYPMDLQKKYNSNYLLREKDAFNNNWANADREYGWAKLAGEMTISAYNKQYGLKGSSARFVTAYGPYENDTHAVIALIRRAVARQDPYVIWGSGKQDRDFTYVDDIVNGALACCQHITNGSAINLGTSKRYTMNETVALIFKIVGWTPKKIIYDMTKPEGVATRALDIKLAKKEVGWEPKVKFQEGLQKTIEWFISEKPPTVEHL